ncbi:hypothetical protein SUGI_0349110 [Cryptomeria japonica]|nr:hypothetical protein SUGI_0349110 [Cryptomeria japonica]
MSLSLISQIVCGKELFEPGSTQATKFRGMVWEALKLSGIPALFDFFPFLERFDLQGLSSKTKIFTQRFENIYNIIIKERLAQRTDMQCNGTKVKDFLDVMLDLGEDGRELSLEIIKAMLMVSWIP